MVEVSEEHPAIDVTINPDARVLHVDIAPNCVDREKPEEACEDFIDQIAIGRIFRNRTSMKAESIPAVVRQSYMSLRPPLEPSISKT